MKRSGLSVFLCLILSLGVLIGCNGTSYHTYLTEVFSGSMPLSIDIIGEKHREAYSEIISTLSELNAQININVESVDPLSPTNKPSDILRLNRAEAGAEIKIGYHAHHLLQVSKDMYAVTGGAFNIALYPLTVLWGVDAYSLTRTPNMPPNPPSFSNYPADVCEFKPSKTRINQFLGFINLDNLTLREDNGEYFATKSDSNLRVDLGAIAKGYAVDLIAEICAKYDIESAFIDLSGNIFMFNRRFEGRKWHDDWVVSLREPARFSARALCSFKTDINTTAVTSGSYQRSRPLLNDISDDVSLALDAAHIIGTDGIPYSLEVVDKNAETWDYRNKNHIISATIIGENSMFADIISTAVCVLGIENGVQFLENIKDEYQISALLFTTDKKMANIGGVQLPNPPQEYDTL